MDGWTTEEEIDYACVQYMCVCVCASSIQTSDLVEERVGR